jgi:hypothetical protein
MTTLPTILKLVRLAIDSGDLSGLRKAVNEYDAALPTLRAKRVQRQRKWRAGRSSTAVRVVDDLPTVTRVDDLPAVDDLQLVDDLQVVMPVDDLPTVPPVDDLPIASVSDAVDDLQPEPEPTIEQIVKLADHRQRTVQLARSLDRLRDDGSHPGLVAGLGDALIEHLLEDPWSLATGRAVAAILREAAAKHFDGDVRGLWSWVSTRMAATF